MLTPPSAPDLVRLAARAGFAFGDLVLAPTSVAPAPINAFSWLAGQVFAHHGTSGTLLAALTLAGPAHEPNLAALEGILSQWYATHAQEERTHRQAGEYGQPPREAHDPEVDEWDELAADPDEVDYPEYPEDEQREQVDPSDYVEAEELGSLYASQHD